MRNCLILVVVTGILSFSHVFSVFEQFRSAVIVLLSDFCDPVIEFLAKTHIVVFARIQ